jgi:hypothetical protein
MRDCISSRNERASAGNPHPGSRALLAGLLLAIATSSASAQTKTLRWNLQPDQRYRITVERSVQQKSPTMGWTELINYQVLWVVGQRDAEDNMQLTQQLTEVKHTLQLSDLQPIVYDSTSAGEPSGDAAELARYWKPLLQVERPVTLSPNGELVRPEAPPAAVAAATPAAAIPTASATTGAATGTGTSAGNNANANTNANRPARLLAGVTWKLPTGEIPLGESWAETQLVPWQETPDALKITTSYTYQGEEEIDQQRLDRIVVQARWDLQPSLKPPDQLTIEGQTATGEIYFNNSAGCLVRSEFSQKLTLRVSRAGADLGPVEILTSLKIGCQPVVTAAPEPAPTETPAAE